MFPLRSHYTTLSNRPEVRSSVHIPMVYEEIPVVPATYDYHVVSIDRSEQDILREEQLNELGRQSWLLLHILDEQTSDKVHYYFVRRTQDTNK